MVAQMLSMSYMFERSTGRGILRATFQTAPSLELLCAQVSSYFVTRMTLVCHV